MQYFVKEYLYKYEYTWYTTYEYEYNVMHQDGAATD